MLFTKIRFFLLLALLCSGPFVAYKLWWLWQSRRVTGVYSFKGLGFAGDQMTLDYSVCRFRLGKDTIWFNGTGNLAFQEGDSIPVRYLVDDPGDARIDVFPAIWGDTLVYGGIPLFTLLLIYLHPKVVPRGRKVRVVWRRPYLLLD
jgi:hypothetical protein